MLIVLTSPMLTATLAGMNPDPSRCPDIDSDLCLHYDPDPCSNSDLFSFLQEYVNARRDLLEMGDNVHTH